MRQTTGPSIILAAAAISLLGWLPTTQAESINSFRFGADERVRQEYFDDIPTKVSGPTSARGGENDYFRFRTRIWAEESRGSNLTFRARVVDENRAWQTPDVTEKPQRSTSEWPDEWVFDNLYIDSRNLFDNALDVRIGRQDLNYGNGKVIFDGTPGDGSRTLYFNAVKATLKSLPKSQLDLFGIYNEAEDELAINPADRDLTGFGKSKEGVTEAGAGLYLKNSAIDNLPFEAYLIYKREGAYSQAAQTNASGFVAPKFAWQTLDPARKTVDNPQFDIETAGFRLMPVFSDSLKGNWESAFQYGQRGDVEMHGFMVDTYLAKTFAQTPAKPILQAGIYCLSGDDPKTTTDEGWDPLWARYPQFSELYAFSWDSEESAARWSNLIAPNMSLTLVPAKRMKTTAAVYYLSAFEADGAGGGKERGWLGTLRNEFVLAENKWLPKDKLTAYLLVEALEPGDYYTKDDTAFFGRWELMYAF